MAENITNTETELNEQQEQNGAGADERKTGEIDVQAEAQKIADAMVAKKLKGMPTKEEVADWKAHKADYIKWRDEQKTEAERQAERQNEIAAKEAAAERKQATADAMIAAAKMGLAAEHIEDAVILAMARTTDETSIEEAMAAVVANNPAWKTGVKLPPTGGNPAKGAEEASTTIKRHF